jgi:hypothetical protein
VDEMRVVVEEEREKVINRYNEKIHGGVNK